MKTKKFRIKVLSFTFFLGLSQLTISQTNWSVEDLHVTTFRNGDALIEVNSEEKLKFCDQNRMPAYYKPGPFFRSNYSNGYLYNYYAISDPRGLAPIGYRIATEEDLSSLNKDTYYQAPSKTWKTRGKGRSFFAEAYGYISNEKFELLSRSMAAYYWTNTLGETLKTIVFVFTDNEPGYLLGELPRESFCAVRCVANENEIADFKSAEQEKLKTAKYEYFERVVSTDEEIIQAEQSIAQLTKEQKDLNKHISYLEDQIQKNDIKIENLETELDNILNPKPKNTSTTTKESNNPFGSGGNNGTQGSGTSPFGNDSGPGGSGTGGIGPGRPVSGEGRTRLNDPSFDHIVTDNDVTIYLKLTINADGVVVSANSTSKTTTTDQRIINQVIAAVKNQVKYNKAPGTGLVTQFLLVKINAR